MGRELEGGMGAILTRFVGEELFEKVMFKQKLVVGLIVSLPSATWQLQHLNMPISSVCRYSFACSVHNPTYANAYAYEGVRWAWSPTPLMWVHAGPHDCPPSWLTAPPSLSSFPRQLGHFPPPPLITADPPRWGPPPPSSLGRSRRSWGL